MKDVIILFKQTSSVDRIRIGKFLDDCGIDYEKFEREYNEGL